MQYFGLADFLTEFVCCRSFCGRHLGKNYWPGLNAHGSPLDPRRGSPQRWQQWCCHGCSCEGSKGSERGPALCGSFARWNSQLHDQDGERFVDDCSWLFHCLTWKCSLASCNCWPFENFLTINCAGGGTTLWQAWSCVILWQCLPTFRATKLWKSWTRKATISFLLWMIKGVYKI